MINWDYIFLSGLITVLSFDKNNCLTVQVIVPAADVLVLWPFVLAVFSKYSNFSLGRQS